MNTGRHILEGAKMIKGTRGRLEVLDREELRDSAGDSYGAPETEYERLITSYTQACSIMRRLRSSSIESAYESVRFSGFAEPGKLT